MKSQYGYLYHIYTGSLERLKVNHAVFGYSWKKLPVSLNYNIMIIHEISRKGAKYIAERKFPQSLGGLFNF